MDRGLAFGNHWSNETATTADIGDEDEKADDDDDIIVHSLCR